MIDYGHIIHDGKSECIGCMTGLTNEECIEKHQCLRCIAHELEILLKEACEHLDCDDWHCSDAHKFREKYPQYFKEVDNVRD
ncbi:MAG: hypothetical protein ACXQTL_05490 [Methanosarcinales archaeon]